MINIIIAFLLSMTPFGELRAGLPFAIIKGIDPATALLVCIVGNFLIVPILFFFLEFIHHRFMHYNHYRSAFDKFMERTRRKAQSKVEKYGYLGIFFLVAIPLPLTGAYTGTLAAWFFGMNKTKSLIAISLGIIVAGLIVLSISLGGLKIFT